MTQNELLDIMARAAHEAYFDDYGMSEIELAIMRNAVEAAIAAAIKATDPPASTG